MGLLATLTGGLLGALPGLLLFLVSELVTGGGDWMFIFGPLAADLTLAGAVVGSILGRRTHDRFAERRLAIGVAGMVSLLAVAALFVITSPDSFLLQQPIVVGLLVGLAFSAYEHRDETSSGSGNGKRLLTTVTGGLLGVLPGLLLYTAGAWITDGGDGMIPFGLGGVALIAVGVVAGLVLGWRTHGRFADQGIAVAATGLAAVLAIVGLTTFSNVGLTAFSNTEMSSPDARDCLEVYEMLGAIRETPEIPRIPPPTRSQIEWAEQQLARLEEESPDDPFCDRLREDLEAQR